MLFLTQITRPEAVKDICSFMPGACTCRVSKLPMTRRNLIIVSTGEANRRPESHLTGGLYGNSRVGTVVGVAETFFRRAGCELAASGLVDLEPPDDQNLRQCIRHG
jgi:hypothetical protein